jgi:hypothetical protein
MHKKAAFVCYFTTLVDPIEMYVNMVFAFVFLHLLPVEEETCSRKGGFPFNANHSTLAARASNTASPLPMFVS